MANSKIIYGGETLMDLTGDTVEKSKLLNPPYIYMHRKGKYV